MLRNDLPKKKKKKRGCFFLELEGTVIHLLIHSMKGKLY